MHVIAGEKMNTYRIAVCDDDPVMREQLHSFCRELLDGESIPYAITAFPSAAELEKRMNSDVEKPFNLLILDIQMNGMTGLELARSLRSKDDRISIIFATIIFPRAMMYSPFIFFLNRFAGKHWQMQSVRILN